MPFRRDQPAAFLRLDRVLGAVALLACSLAAMPATIDGMASLGAAAQEPCGAHARLGRLTGIVAPAEQAMFVRASPARTSLDGDRALPFAPMNPVPGSAPGSEPETRTRAPGIYLTQKWPN